MKNAKWFMSVILLCVMSSVLWAQNGPEQTNEKRKEMTKAEKIATVRIIAAAMPGNALKDWMTSGALKKWNGIYGPFIQEDGSSAIMKDFFSSALLLIGPQTDFSGIFAFYNPLQDSILLIQADNTGSLPRIEDFVFMTGNDFRNQPLKKDEYPQAIVPTKEKLDSVLIKNTGMVSLIFHREFPSNAKDISLGKYRKFNNDDSFQKVASHATLRMEILKKFTMPEAAADAEIAGEIALQLWKGDLAEMKNYFQIQPESMIFVERFAKLDKRVKTTLFPVLYLKNKKEILFGFSSRALPELIVLTKVSAEGKSKPSFVALPLNERFCAEVTAETK